MNKNSTIHSRIAATGIYLPEKILTNAELERMVETSDEWIVTRTGIRERRIAAANETTSDMAAQAALNAIQRARITPKDVDMIIVATVTPDTFFPSTACHVQRKIGATRAAAFDISAACSGFLYGVIMADHFIRAGTYKNILVIGAEKLSSVVDWKDRNTCVLFGDGAGAALIQESKDGKGILAHNMGSNGEYHQMLYMNNIQNRNEQMQTQLPAQYIQMSGKEVFKQAVNAMAGAANDVIGKAGCTMADLRCVVTHQANIRIIECLADKLKIPKDKCFINVHKYGNISAACIPIALREAEDFYPLKRGDKILLVAFGGGLTWAATLLEW
ncbi:MAG: beta-ketoacyl-ACP synthase III [Verrucomicrobiota bacterium]